MLKAIHASLDEIPDEFRALYTEKKNAASGEPQWELTGIEGVKTPADIERLDKALKAERTEHAKTKDRLKAFGDRTPDAIEALEAQVIELQAQVEAGGKPDEAGINKLVEARIPAFTKPLERERDALKARLAELEAENGALKLAGLRRSMSDAFRAEVTGDKRVPLKPTAVEDVELYVERMFTLEDGKWVTKDGVGVTPGMSIREWLTETQAEGRRPHWFEGNTPAGATGSQGSGGAHSGDNPFEAKTFNLTKASDLATADVNRARALYRAAKDKTKAKGPFGHLA